MALIDQIRALVEAGAKEHEFQQALRQVMEEQEQAKAAVDLPNLPTIPPAYWNPLKAYLTAPGGPHNPFRMLQIVHEGVDEDNPVKCLRAMIGLVHAVWHDHPGWRRASAGPGPPPQ